MKKKLLSLLVAICLILPFGFALTACGGHTHTEPEAYSSDNTHHWKVCADEDCAEVYDKAEHTFTETTTAATIDAEGKVVKTCSVCAKVVETVIPKVAQTRAEMIAKLGEAVKASNYEGNIQEVYTNISNTEDYMSSEDAEFVDIEYNVKKADGSVSNYYVSSDKPGTYQGSEYIAFGTLTKKVGEEWLNYSFSADNTKTDLRSVERVGANYSKALAWDTIKNNLDYLLVIKNEETLVSALQDTLAGYMPMYQAMFGYCSDYFTFDVDDIEVEVDVSYADGKYKAVGTIVLDKLTHSNPSASKMVKDFKVEFEVVYTNDLVVKNYSKFIYNIDTDPSSEADELDQVYIINDDAYSRTVEDAHFTKLETIISGHTPEIPPVDRKERVVLYVNGNEFVSGEVVFGTPINEKVDELIQIHLRDNDVDDYSTISVYLDEACTVPYDPDENVFVEDYYGTNVYVKVVAFDGYSAVFTEYKLYYTNTLGESSIIREISIVTEGDLTLEYASVNPDYDEGVPGSPLTVDYDDKLVINGVEQSMTPTRPESIDIEAKEYHIVYYYYYTLDLG